jgi:hypothetical protein
MYPEKASKMRNHLATMALDANMLHLLEVYRENSGRSDLDGTIALLEKTSVMVENYRNSRPVTPLHDERLTSNQMLLDWWQEWEKECKQKGKAFITRECYNDLLSMFLGTASLIAIKLKEFPLTSFSLRRLNSDVIENIFCSQRGICNGSNSNPNYYQYCSGMNAITIGQPIKSSKSNAGGKVCVGGALPYKCHVKKSFNGLRL